MKIKDDVKLRLPGLRQWQLRLTRAHLLIIFCLLLVPITQFASRIGTSHVAAKITALPFTQGDAQVAPAKPIQPVAIAVVNFTQLAALTVETNKQVHSQTSAESRAAAPPRSITEVDTKVSTAIPRETKQRSAVQPEGSSPAPSQSFLAQEDALEVGTGSFVIPPDTMGAVGTDKLFVTLNNNYRIQDKTTGSVLSTVSINAFWSSTGASDIFDPHTQYDPYNNRWILAAISSGGTPSSSVLIGISATSDPQGTFTLFRFNVGCGAGTANCDPNGETADFPMLGFNKNWVAVGWNQFQIGGSGDFIAGKMLAVDYPSLRNGTSNSTIFTVTLASNVASFCMHPATTWSPSEESLYVPTHVSSAAATYRLHKLTGTPGAPVYMVDTVSKTRPGGGWSVPSGDILPQTCVGIPGNTCPTAPRFIDTADAQIRSDVVFRNGNVWYAQTIALPVDSLTHTAAQWTRIDTSGNFIDGGRVEDPNANSSTGEWYAYASIAVNANGDALLGFSNFGRNHFARAGYTIRLAADPAGTMRDPVIFKDGEDYYSKTFGGSRNRWGDFSLSTVDPANDQDFWTIQEYAGTRVVQDGQQTTNSSRWGTWWAKVPPNGPPPVCTVNFTVNDNGDAADSSVGDGVCATAAGVCTLRAAIQEANALSCPNVTNIGFASIGAGIFLTAPLPDLNHDINIVGRGADNFTVQRTNTSGAPNFRVFTIPAGRTVAISDLRISNGSVTGSDNGGGVLNNGTLTLKNCNIYGNNANNNGGGIFNSGSLTIVNSNVGGVALGEPNSATGASGALGGGGGIYSNGTLNIIGSFIGGNTSFSGGGILNLNGAINITNSTISNNSTAGEGGGVLNVSAKLILSSVTITNNRCDSDNTNGEHGGGIVLRGFTETLRNTIVAGNFRGSGTTADDIPSTSDDISSSSFNVIGIGGSGGLTNGINHNQVGVGNPGLDTVAFNGGTTWTHALLPGSPAIDAGSNALATDPDNNQLTTDQRGAGFVRVVNGTVDVGAFEFQAPSATPTPTPTPSPTPSCPTNFIVNDNGDATDAAIGNGVCSTSGGVCTLRAALEEANADVGCGTITINLNLVGAINLTTALPEIRHNVNLVGPNAGQLALQRSVASGTAEFRVLAINGAATVAISGLTIANGKLTVAANGAGILNMGTLLVTMCNIYGNSTVTNFGPGTGGIYNGGSLTLVNSNVGGTAAGQGNIGEGIRSVGALNMTGGGIVGNSSGISSGGTTFLNGVSISNNAVGGGINVFSSTNPITIINCLIANNTNTKSHGGGIYNVLGTVLIFNSTISGNNVPLNAGGGISNFNGTIKLTNVTVTNNHSTLGGGIEVSGSILMNNTIVAGNFAISTPDDLATGNVNSASAFNLIGICGACGLTNGTNGNQVGVTNPGLAALENNGGTTLTHALLPGSPAIDTGSNVLARDQNNNALATDQRGAGFSRIVNGTVDIGAFENQSPGSPLLQFSAATYAVTEGDPNNPRVNITVTRSGNTSAAASVNFGTIDDAGLQQCSTINGTASPRCDFIYTTGTLTWASGDASPKMFSVAIIDDSYAEGAENFRVGLSNPTGASLGVPSTATVTITDNEAVNGPNPIDQTDFFVRQQYIDFLGREPDPGGFAGWTSAINNCAPGDTSCDRIHVSQLFYQSNEFQSRGYYVFKFYPVSFPGVAGVDPPGAGHKPDYAQFAPDLAAVSGFLTDAQLDAAKNQFAIDFTNRAAFMARYPSSMTPTQYVDTLLSTAGVSGNFNATTRQNLIDGLTGGTLTRAQVLRQIVDSAEVSAKYFNEAYVVMEYFGYLRRDPDALYLNWLDVINQTNDPRGMVNGFANSTEYKQRFGP